MLAQIKGVLLTLVRSGVGSFTIYRVVDILLELRVSVEQEREDLDLALAIERPGANQGPSLFFGMACLISRHVRQYD